MDHLGYELGDFLTAESEEFFSDLIKEIDLLLEDLPVGDRDPDEILKE